MTSMHYVELTDKANGDKILVNLALSYKIGPLPGGGTEIQVQNAPPVRVTESIEDIKRLLLE